MKKSIQKASFILAPLFLLLSCNNKTQEKTIEKVKVQATKQVKSSTTSTSKIIPISEVQWDALNPARGDKSPQAGTLWGNRKGTEATGFLVKFLDGFSSPPHIHNVSYKGLVITGLIHNDDPNASTLWMPSGSYWTQPPGESHITAAKGDHNMAYIEIESGPYLVKPVKEAFDNGEKPINIDASNMVWVNLPENQSSIKGIKIAYLWGSPEEGQLNGTLIKLPKGFKGTLDIQDSTLRAVILQGKLDYHTSKNDTQILEAGSYFSSEGNFKHTISATEQDCMVYIRTKGKFNIR
ncbi:hypothetical protein UJ101_01786 [Flavobacteriaceae bacterium UJ101]|nr:hypothetical protein UJ101_01786 [Flavobacteriaceae bacterium UJ101]